MPSYTYQCKSCETVQELQIPMSEMYEPEEKPCPACGALEVKKVILQAPTLGYSTKPPGMNISDNFNDRLKQIDKRGGKQSTVGQSLKK